MSRQSQLWSRLVLTSLFSLHFAIADAHQSLSNRSSGPLARAESVTRFQNSKPNLNPDLRRTPIQQTLRLRQQQQAPRTHYCNLEPTLKEVVDCFQLVLEMYYGPELTYDCPQAGFHVSFCTGCPWDSISPKLRQNHSAPLPPDFFRKVEPSCKIADLFREFTDFETLNKHVFRAGVHMSLLLVVLSVFGISSGSKTGMMSPVTLLKFKIPEVAYLGVLWLVYNTVHILAARSASYYLFCDSYATYASHMAVDTIAYASVLFISASRCLRLSSGPKISDGDPEESSWLSFIFGVTWGQVSRSRGNVLLSLSVGLVQLILIASFFVDYRVPYNFGRDSDSEQPYCVTGHKDLAMGLIQISKIVLETLCVLVYASGVKLGPWRRATLVFILLASWALFFSMIPASGPYKQNSMSMTIPRTLDTDLATDLTEIAHVTFVAFLGILEPFRLKAQINQGPVEP